MHHAAIGDRGWVPLRLLLYALLFSIVDWQGFSSPLLFTAPVVGSGVGSYIVAAVTMPAALIVPVVVGWVKTAPPLSPQVA